jgi:hypothetical protein
MAVPKGSGSWSRPGDPARAAAPVGDLVLVERRRGRAPGSEWSALAPDGTPVTVRTLPGGQQHPDAEALAALPHIRHPDLVPVLAVGERAGELWVASEMGRGCSLRRLLAVAALTPEQAALVVSGVVAGLDALERAGRAHGRLDEGAVQIGPEGGVRLAGWGLEPALDAESGRRTDRQAAARLFGLLGRGVHRSGSATRRAGSSLLQALEACVGTVEDPSLALDAARRSASATLAGEAGDRARHELAALVAALGPEWVGRPAPTAGPARERPAPVPAAVWRRQRRPPLVAVGLVALLVATVLGAAVVAARHPPLRLPGAPNAPAALARPSGTPAPRPTAHPPTPTPQPSGPRPPGAPAPPAAGPVTAVQVQPLQGACQPDAACPVQVTVRLDPQPSADEVRWSFRVVDRCTGATSTLPGAGVTALAGWPYVFATGWPQLPSGHALALFAVTEAPAVAASPALLAGGGPC